MTINLGNNFNKLPMATGVDIRAIQKKNQEKGINTKGEKLLFKNGDISKPVLEKYPDATVNALKTKYLGVAPDSRSQEAKQYHEEVRAYQKKSEASQKAAPKFMGKTVISESDLKAMLEEKQTAPAPRKKTLQEFLQEKKPKLVAKTRIAATIDKLKSLVKLPSFITA